MMNSAPRYSTIGRFAIITALLLVGCNGCVAKRPVPAHAGSPMPVRLHWHRVEPEPRRELAARYVALFHTPQAHEYGFCAIMRPSPDDGVLTVVAAAIPDSQITGPNFTTFRCPPGTIRGHAHPPAACYMNPLRPGEPLPETCAFGTSWGHQCMPSTGDVAVARKWKQVAILQCDVHAFLFYSAGDSA